MFRLVFAIIWTAVILGALLIGAGRDGFERAILGLMLAAGLLFVWHSWRDLRRRRSVRTEREGDATVYVWTEFDGTERRSDRDPRPDWDAADGDGGGGDGGGGD